MKLTTITILFSFVLALPLRAQQVDPSARYRTAESAHFRISFTPELAELVKPSVDRAEEAYNMLSQQLTMRPKGKIDILLSDNSDVTNGFASQFPSSRITIFVKPPVSDIDLQYYRDWLDLVITHELAHAFHQDVAGSAGRALRSVFGRVPFNWPVFPAIESPGWVTEGLAVEFETRGTASARLHGAFHEMVVRTAVFEDAFDPIDRITGDTPIWPGGIRQYVYGSLFMDYLARKHGANAQAEITRKTASSVLPPRLVFNQIGSRAVGSSFTEEYAAWRKDLNQVYEELRDSLVAAGLTQSERLTTPGRYAQFPRVSPDGRYIAFAEENGRNEARTHVIEIATGRTVWTRRRNGIGPSAWVADGSLLTAQFEFSNRYALRSDLYHIARRGQRRLTRSARIEEPDVDKRGRIVAVELGPGTNRLVRLDSDGKTIRALNEFAADVNWSTPRWSPDGERIAVARWREGGKYDVVLLDTLGKVKQELTDDEAVDATPAWSPDGRYVLFWSDRTGIPNLFAYDTQGRKLLQVTSVLTGAFHPEVSPDGRSIYFAGYHADGYHIQRTPFDTTAWRAAEPPRPASFLRPREPFDSAAALHVPASIQEARSYRPWRTLRPYYWLPFGASITDVGTFLGLSTSGRDLVGRHAYALGYAHDFDRNRNFGYLAYSYAGLRNPSIDVAFSRDWDLLGTLRVVPPEPRPDTSRVQVVEREDVAELATTFVLRRYRWSMAFTVGGEAVLRDRMVNDSPNVTFGDPDDHMFGPIARLSFANYRTPAYAISREDGIVLQVAARWRAEPDTAVFDRSYQELTTWNALYRSLPLPGFAHHVIALRMSGLVRSGTVPPLAEVGGAPGGTFDLGVTAVGNAGGLLPVRGFLDGTRVGTRAWSASAEYRVPLTIVGRGLQLWPLFLDRTFLSAFVDAGDAECNDQLFALSPACQQRTGDALLSIGGELGLDVGLLSYSNTRARIGFAQPLSGPRRQPMLYLSFGSAF